MSAGPEIRAPRPPERIVCLTEEPTEILYGLGEQDRIVGISAFTVRPPEAPRSHPVVSAFTGGSVEKIRALDPDLCVGFSDIQGKLARQLVEAGLPVLIFNQRSVEEILDVILQLGQLVGAGQRARDWAAQLRGRLLEVAARPRDRSRGSTSRSGTIRRSAASAGSASWSGSPAGPMSSPTAPAPAPWPAPAP